MVSFSSGNAEMQFFLLLLFFSCTFLGIEARTLPIPGTLLLSYIPSRPSSFLRGTRRIRVRYFSTRGVLPETSLGVSVYNQKEKGRQVSLELATKVKQRGSGYKTEMKAVCISRANLSTNPNQHLSLSLSGNV